MTALIVGCAPADDDGFPTAGAPSSIHPDDLVIETDGKQDSAYFDQNNLIDDAVFQDADYLFVKEVQTLLEESPYGRRCFLADYTTEGLRASEIIVETAQTYQINPLVLVTRLQVETGLISKTSDPSSYSLNHAMGCACHDYTPCNPSYAGFARQLDCGGATLRGYLNDLDNGDATITGWRPGNSKESEDGIIVTPDNKATAALYTYTPWVLQNAGGNWLFWNVYRKYSRFVLSEQPNHRWIGGSCNADTDCRVDSGQCLRNDDPGTCSAPCDGICPDIDQAYTATTFCVDLGSPMDGDAAGWCLAHCDESLIATNGGCPERTECVTTTRFGNDAVEKSVCWPDSVPRS